MGSRVRSRICCVVGSHTIEIPCGGDRKTSVLDSQYYKGHGGDFPTRPYVMCFEYLNTKRLTSCCARKLNGDKRRIFLTPQEWKGKAYAITQFDQLSMIMEYEEIATDNEGL